MKKKNKTPRFLICENPMTAAEDGRLFILHLGEPATIVAEVHHYDNLADEMQIERELNPNFGDEPSITAGARLDYPPETIFFHPIIIYPGGMWHKYSAQESADELAKIMRRMEDWYKSYLIWEDKNL